MSSHPAWPLEEQVARAARIQRALLPDLSAPLGQYRLASLYRPCEALGGDFHDLVRDRGRAVLLVADVMGHGIEAALPMMLLRVVFRDAAAHVDQPLEILNEMSFRLRETIATDAFVAATVVCLDLAAFSLRLANAGLPHPYVLRAGSGRVERVSVNGFPLGLLGSENGSCREVATLTLAPGDVLFLASDGLGAVENDRQESFADRQLEHALARLTGCDGHEVIRCLMREALAFGGAAALPDDVNLVAVTRRRRPEPETTEEPEKPQTTL